ncbi:5-methyltetrahydrofolate--homocysteine methyltransferase [Enterococcus sp. PF1-24]|uniref:homocysteine S-methyltransferase family protein n=1 Tax=unclassified Enterococcus TaxID=2608891 RepID=UPI002473ED7F|nr:MULTISPECIES: homocysteine S-methyltransferase family protein [unclassified Enterococcus]MDH6365713.1 5-methyltetrahydrofolate--homocysteine methyltransferase [Enterococcus sp. PFB1-1]MDH6402813.1 5-methyltetrahydrofolate--homocysteine methyltransferase [Enterococcus sp. PF1-24]
MTTIIEAIENKVLLFDGAMGTMMQKHGLPVGMEPEYFNLSHPETVKEIHQAYVSAGADVITTNTFQANRLKLAAEQLPEIISAAVKLAQAANPRYVAYDMGPTGQLMAPMGTLSFDEAYDVFKEQALLAEAAGADVVILETMSDLLETKAAILAIKENTNLPIFCTMTFQADGRTFVGTDPITAVLTLQSLGIAAVGLNCSLGPQELLPLVEKMLQYAKITVMVQANAGLPEMKNGQTVYRISESDYGTAVKEMLTKGVRIVGGCCGTTPAFIKELRGIIDATPFMLAKPEIVTAVTSGNQSVILNQGLHLIGERINPTGKKRLKEALRSNDISYLLKEALKQVEAGADILDVNVGLPEIDEAEMMQRAVTEIQGIVTTPLQIDSSSVAAIETGARYYNGKPLINSVNGKASSMAEIFPIVKKYGGVVLGLALDENGIPETAAERLAIAKKIVDTAATYGIPKEDVMIDPLVLTASAQQAQVAVTLETLRLLRSELGVMTVAGLSNVSFGLPNRELLNGTFLAAAVGAGLNAPIVNPLSEFLMNIVRGLKVINNQDKDATAYIANSQTMTVAANEKAAPVTNKAPETLKELILQGQKDLTAAAATELLKTQAPLEIVNQHFIPALDEVGRKFETGELFLPQLIQSAEAVQRAQEVLKKYFDAQGQVNESQGKILLATVEGDIHDIGKNIVKMVLENYGFEVIDLGKDVPVEKVVETVRQEKIALVGLSALMTTTVQNMKRTIEAVKAAGLPAKFMVGGAVLNEEYREFVGADYYAKDALESVTIAQNFFKS